MRNEHFYKIVIVLLLLLNGGTLGYLWLSKSRQESGHVPPGMHHRNHVDRLMSEKLALTAEQEEQFQELKQEHNGHMIELQQAEKRLHIELFKLLKARTDTLAKNNLLAELERNDRRKEEVTFDHFRKLRSILNPEQQPKFDELMEEIASQILSHRRIGSQAHPGGPPPPPPGH
jgi:protein CpxP